MGRNGPANHSRRGWRAPRGLLSSAQSVPNTTRTRGVLALLLCTIGIGWWWIASGLVSSNDGSHVALARALALRGQSSIDPDVGLTLFVDRAEREGHQYSDRPPGTAFLALPSVWLGGQLDEPWLKESRSNQELVARPATDRFAHTHAARVQRLGVASPPLLALQGTAVAVTLHAIAMGLLGLVLLEHLLARWRVEPGARFFAVGVLGVASLWGPYSTMLFSHVTSGTLVLGLLVALDHALDRSPGRARAAWSFVAGLCGSWAIASDYALLLAVVPIVVLHGAPSTWRSTWPWIAAGAVLPAVATLAYHQAAFGSPWSIGYDFQTNFGFARERSSTFDSDPLSGAWILLGSGRDAGLLAQAPIMLLGVPATLLAPRRRWVWGLVPWLVLLSFHRTPWGGATEDHRYLVPMLGVLAAGLGLGWQWLSDMSRPGMRWFVALAKAIVVALTLASSVGVWTHFFAWRG